MYSYTVYIKIYLQTQAIVSLIKSKEEKFMALWCLFALSLSSFYVEFVKEISPSSHMGGV